MSSSKFLANSKTETFIFVLIGVVFAGSILTIVALSRSDNNTQNQMGETFTESPAIDQTSDLSDAEEYLESQSFEEQLDTSDLDAALTE